MEVTVTVHFPNLKPRMTPLAGTIRVVMIAVASEIEIVYDRF